MRSRRFSQLLLLWSVVLCICGSAAVRTSDSGSAAEREERPWLLTLCNGDRIVGELRAATGRRFEIKSCFGNITIRGDWVWLASVFWGELAPAEIWKGDKTLDTVYLSRGPDPIRKGRAKWTPDGRIELVEDGETVQFDRKELQAIVFSEDRASRRAWKPTGRLAAARLRLLDGSLVTGEVTELSKEAVKLRAPYLPKDATIPLRCITFLSFVSERKTCGEGEGRITSAAVPADTFFFGKDLGFIQGRIVTLEGRPLTGCLVWFYNVAANRFYGEDNIFHMETHTVNGLYTSPPLKPGRYVVIALFCNRQEWDTGILLGLAPGVRVGAGKVTPADLTACGVGEKHEEIKDDPLLAGLLQKAYQTRGDRLNDWFMAHDHSPMDFGGW